MCLLPISWKVQQIIRFCRKLKKKKRPFFVVCLLAESESEFIHQVCRCQTRNLTAVVLWSSSCREVLQIIRSKSRSSLTSSMLSADISCLSTTIVSLLARCLLLFQAIPVLSSFVASGTSCAAVTSRGTDSGAELT